MKNILLIVSTIILGLLTSCSNDDSNPDEAPLQLIKVYEQITMGTEIFSEGTVEYTYGLNGYLRLFTASNFSNKYLYNENDQLTELILTTESHGQSSSFYSYDEELITQSFDTVTDSKIFYEYNNNSQLVRVYHPYNDIRYEYDTKGNVSAIIVDSEIYNRFLYDDMKNPFSLLFPDAYNKIRGISYHNKIYSERDKEKTIFEYNENKYPVTSTKTIAGGYVIKREYYYNR
ncbi:hypothetical protein GCM10022393_05050 [Aquimarina addita]|uniref:YD repeat-containing protein n=1 Tax=Aquimarina addita TaxID=870485 RepID=A0ABP7X9W0_9FLAO